MCRRGKSVERQRELLYVGGSVAFREQPALDCGDDGREEVDGKVVSHHEGRYVRSVGCHIIAREAGDVRDARIDGILLAATDGELSPLGIVDAGC